MMNIIRKALLIITVSAFSIHSYGQEIEYSLELGGMAGGSFYMGDANYSHLFMETGLCGGAVLRQLLNPHMAVKYDLAAGKISGDTRNIKDAFPHDVRMTFSRTVIDAGAQFEYNFWSYGTGKGYKGTKRLTPYILGGIGFTFAPAPADNVFTLNFPIGVGVKYKLLDRLNVGIEFTMRFSMSDRLDVTDKNGLTLQNPFNIKGKGIKNKDSYSFTAIFVTYDLKPKYRKCNNIDL